MRSVTCALAVLLCALGCDPELVRPDPDAGPNLGDGGRSCEPCGSQCVDLSSDPRHCGMCNNRCPEGTFCSNRMCQTSCSAPRTACGEDCVDLATSREHCGECGESCGAGQQCRSGDCECTGSLLECGDECVDTDTSLEHCGDCDRACGADETCSDGDCVSTVETECLDGDDGDLDGRTDCLDPDCFGTTVECTCPEGRAPPAGRTPSQVCQAGVWSQCGPCDVPPLCSETVPCPYGNDCVSGECVFNPDARFDLVLVSADIPGHPEHGDWDTGTGFLRGPEPDVKVIFYVGPELSGAPPRGSTIVDDTYTPQWNEVTVRRTSARDFIRYTQIDVWDDDSYVPSGELQELIGSCTVNFELEDFDGSEVTLDCEPSSLGPGWRIRVRFAEP